MRCIKCEIDKSEEDFSWTNKAEKKRNLWCRPCTKIYDKARYDNFTPEQTDRKTQAQKARKLRNAQYVWDYLKEHPCVDCSEADPIVLEFDHQRDKLMNVGDLLRGVYSLQKIRLEIEKCLVRCANCHRRKTAKDFNYFVGK